MGEGGENLGGSVSAGGFEGLTEGFLERSFKDEKTRFSAQSASKPDFSDKVEEHEGEWMTMGTASSPLSTRPARPQAE